MENTELFDTTNSVIINAMCYHKFHLLSSSMISLQNWMMNVIVNGLNKYYGIV